MQLYHVVSPCLSLINLDNCTLIELKETQKAENWCLILGLVLCFSASTLKAHRKLLLPEVGPCEAPLHGCGTGAWLAGATWALGVAALACTGPGPFLMRACWLAVVVLVGVHTLRRYLTCVYVWIQKTSEQCGTKQACFPASAEHRRLQDSAWVEGGEWPCHPVERNRSGPGACKPFFVSYKIRWIWLCLWTRT